MDPIDRMKTGNIIYTLPKTLIFQGLQYVPVPAETLVVMGSRCIYVYTYIYIYTSMYLFAANICLSVYLI